MSKIEVKRQIHHYLIYIWQRKILQRIKSLYGNNYKKMCGGDDHGILSAGLKQNVILVSYQKIVPLLRP